jgi:hypothetical protein
MRVDCPIKGSSGELNDMLYYALCNVYIYIFCCFILILYFYLSFFSFYFLKIGTGPCNTSHLIKTIRRTQWCSLRFYFVMYIYFVVYFDF